MVTPVTAEQKELAEELWCKGVQEYTLGRRFAGLEAFKASVEADPHHAERHHFIGCCLSAFQGNLVEATKCYKRAIDTDPEFWLAYQELCLLHEAHEDYEMGRVFAKAAIQAGVRWQDEWQHPPMWTPGLTSSPWWDGCGFPWVSELEASWTQIRDEVLQFPCSEDNLGMPSWDPVGSQKASHDAAIVENGGNWQEFVLFSASHSKQAEVAELFPKTMDILQRTVPSAIQMAQMGVGEIILSALAPATRLKPHCASTNLRLTCHLGLVCPEGARIKVGPTWGFWEEGKCTFFDDSYMHEVINDADSVRIVLLIRFWHPELIVSDVAQKLEKSIEEHNLMNDMRTCPPTSELCKIKLREAAEARIVQKMGSTITLANQNALLNTASNAMTIASTESS